MMEKAQKKTPNLRFKGFTDDWEQRKLGEISERILRKNSDLQSLLPLTISAQDGLVDQTIYFNKQVASKQLKNYLLLYNGDFAYNKSYSVGYPYGAIKRLDKYKQGVLSTLYIAFKPTNINSDFLQHYYDTDKWYREIYRNAAEGARNHGLLNISANDFFNSKLITPSDNDEQLKIAKIINVFNRLITLQQRKLDLLKQLKKGLLQKMFAAEKNSKQPALRFKGFHDDWEQHKLGDALEEFSYGLNTPATKFDGKNKYLRITDIDDDTHAFNQISLTSPKDKDDNYILGQGDILFARTGASVGKTYMYKANDGKVYYAGFLIKGHIKNGFSTEFIFNTTRLPQYQNFVKVTSMRSGQPGINAKEYQNYVIYVPVKQEQERIGQLISKLDTLITLHQQKLNKLNNLKQGLLQQMFI